LFNNDQLALASLHSGVQPGEASFQHNDGQYTSSDYDDYLGVLRGKGGP